MKPPAFRLFAASQLVLCLTVLPAMAADYTWDGTDNLYSTAHWNPGSIIWPGINNSAIIDSGKVTVDGTWGVDAVTVSGGTLDVVTGGLFNRAFALNVANSTTNALVTVNGGTVSRNFIDVGRGTGVGVITVNSGTLSSTGEIWLGSNGAAAGFGVMNITNGTVNTGSWLALGRGATAGYQDTRGVLNVSGGELNVGAGGSLSIGAFLVSGSATSLMRLSNGTVNVARTVFVGENGQGILDMSGGNLNVGSAWVGEGVQIKNTLNLRGGTLSTNFVANRAGGTSILNFNGGTLKAQIDSTTFLQGLAQANIFGGGATIDTNGKNITIVQALIAPAGNGISSITGLTGSGYAAAPIIEISDSTGKGATAVANIDGNGNLTSITITNPGTNYSNSPSITLVGGGGSYSGTPTFVTAANTSGGLTKTGAGTLTLTAMNTFTGDLTINQGTLVAGTTAEGSLVLAPTTSNLGALQPSSNRNITVNNGGTLSLTGGNVLGAGASTNTLSNTTLVVNAGGVFRTGLDGSGTGWWNKIGAVSLNGGTMKIGTGGNNTTFQGLSLIGTVTVGGSTASSIENFAASDGAMNGIHLGQNSTANQVITFDVADVTGSAATDLTVSAKLLNTSNTSTASGLTKQGSGTMLLSGNNTYTGATKVTAGTLVLSGTNIATGSGNLVIDGATTLTKITGGSTTINSTAGDTYVVGGGTLEIDGGALTLQGGGSWFSVGRSYGSGGAGTLTLKSGSFTTTNQHGLTVSDKTGTINISGGTFTANGTANNGIILGEASGGNGTLNLSGGTLITDQIRGGGGVGAVNFDGGKLQATGDLVDVFANNNNITTTILEGGLKVGGTLNFTISEAMVGVGGIIKEDGNIVTLSGANTYTGGTTITNGTLALGATNVLADTGAVTVNGGIFDIGANSDTVGAVTLTSGSITGTTGILTGSSYDVRSGSITARLGGAAGLSKTTAGTVALSGNNTYTGTTTVSTGTLELTGTNTGLGNLAINGATALTKVTAGATTINSVTNGTYIIGGGTLEIDGGALTLQGENSWFSVGNNDQGSGAGTLTLNSGSFTTTNRFGLTVANDTGTINIQGGTFTANGSYNNGIALGESSGGNGTLNLNGGVLITDRIRGGFGVGAVNFNGGKLQSTGDVTDDFFFADAGNKITTTIQSGGLKVGGTPTFTISEAMGGTGALIKEDANTVTLFGVNSYTGGTSVTAGTLVLANNSAAGNVAGEISVSGATAVLKISSGISVGNTIKVTNKDSKVQRVVAATTGLNTTDDYTVGTTGTGTLKSSFTGGKPDTSAKILAGTNSGGTEKILEMLFSDTSAATNDGIRRSDVFKIDGTGTDTFVIELSATGLAGDSVLGWLNGSNQWVNAVTGNTGNNASPGQLGFLGSFATFQGSNGTTLGDYIGAYGFDSSGGSAWAVVNHGGSFTVVPEPTTALAGLLLTAGLLRRRR